MTNYKNLRLSNHPLIHHKLSLMRDKYCSSDRFYRLTKEIGILLAYEVTIDNELIKISNIQIETPVGIATTPVIQGHKPVIVPILRAGLPLAEGFKEVLPMARTGHIGMQRDESYAARPYVVILPETENRSFIIVDPVIATGNTACRTVEILKELDIAEESIRFVTIILAAEGINQMAERHPKVRVYGVKIDEQLDEATKFILPGFGDAGDRLFGTG